jgi:hypothetical protein
MKLNGSLNNTYVYYGATGASAKSRQEVQDMNAATMSPEASIQRVNAKSGKMYSNASWDIVDGIKDNKKMLEEMNDEELPDTLKKMTKEERVKYVEGKSKEREEIQAKIKDLSEKRDKFVADERKKLSTETESTLDAALIKSLKTKATEKNFEFGK